MVDPVCGMSVSPDSAHHREHAGRHYAFCSAGCRTKFEADRTRYVDERGLRRVAAAAAAHPMHGGHDHANQTSAPVALKPSLGQVPTGISFKYFAADSKEAYGVFRRH